MSPRSVLFFTVLILHLHLDVGQFNLGDLLAHLPSFGAMSFGRKFASNVSRGKKSLIGVNQRNQNINPEATMTINEVIRYHGYPLEIHEIVTDDGYILTIQRIPHGKNHKKSQSYLGKPVLIQHGLLCSSGVWLSNTPDKILPYQLADAGFDVWLGNVRGSSQGNKHIKFTPADEKFWDFSFQEMADIDIPNVIDMIVEKTKYEQIYYVGHSLGTLMIFAVLSSQPKYNEIIEKAFLLAPVTTPVHSKGLAKLLKPVSGVFTLLSIHESLSLKVFLRSTFNLICNSQSQICSELLFFICGSNPAQFNESRKDVFLHFTPELTSIGMFVHLYQLITSKKFQRLNHGHEINFKKYKTVDPPEYDLKKITTKLYLFWSDNDYLAVPEDVHILEKKLKSIEVSHRIPDKNFMHMDFIWAMDVNYFVFDKLLKLMKI